MYTFFSPLSFFGSPLALSLSVLPTQCMDAFGESKLMDLSQVEQTMSTGVDEEGKEVKGQKLIALLLDTFKAKIPKLQKLRLLSIFIASQRDATPEDKRTLVQVCVLQQMYQ
jgi:hypothetical protein